MRKKVWVAALILAMSVSMTACGGTETGNTSADVSEEADVQEDVSEEDVDAEDEETDTEEEIAVTDYPKIEDFSWTFSDGVLYLEPAALFGYTNNSSFTVLKLELTFQSTDGSDELSIYDWMVCDPGESVDGADCYLNGQTATASEQCENMELVSAEITYLAEGDKRCTVDYAAENGGYSDVRISSDDLFMWSESAYAKAVPKPDFQFVTVDYDEPDVFQYTIYDVDNNAYVEYIKTCEDAGFNNNIEKSDLSFFGTNEDGLRVHARYFTHMNAMEIEVEEVEDD